MFVGEVELRRVFLCFLFFVFDFVLATFVRAAVGSQFCGRSIVCTMASSDSDDMIQKACPQ